MWNATMKAILKIDICLLIRHKAYSHPFSLQTLSAETLTNCPKTLTEATSIADMNPTHASV